MKSARRARWNAFSLLGALLCSTALPRAFIVCVSEGDHVSLEAAFEADPCETNFVFGARSDASGPAETCTDIPATQISAAPTNDSRALLVLAPAALLPGVSAPYPASPEPIRHLTDWRDAPRRPRSDQIALRKTVLRI